MLDDTPPGILLVAAQYLQAKPACRETVKELLPHLPPRDEEPDLREAEVLLAHPYIRERKKGLALIENLLAEGKYHERLLAILEGLVERDESIQVRDISQRLLEAEAKKTAPPPLPEGSRHTFSVRCPNGHTHWFDKRRVCPDDGTLKRSRSTRGGKVLDDIYLKCPECGTEIIVPVDCEGYR